MSGHCLNCDTTINASYNHCPECGQKTTLHRLSLHEILHDAIHYFTHADKGIFQLLKALALKTGTVANEYVTGKRKKYFPPLNFFLLVGAIFVFAVNSLHIYDKTKSENYKAELSHITDPVVRAQVEKIKERQFEAVHFVNKYANFVAMLAVPLITCIFFLFYRKAVFNYTEHLVANMYMNGFCNLIYIFLLSILSAIVPLNTNYFSMIFFLVFQVPYNANFYYRFINQKTKAGVIKAGAAAFTAVLFWVALSSTLIGVYIRSGFWGLFS